MLSVKVARLMETRASAAMRMIISKIEADNNQLTKIVDAVWHMLKSQTTEPTDCRKMCGEGSIVEKGK